MKEETKNKLYNLLAATTLGSAVIAFGSYIEQVADQSLSFAQENLEQIVEETEGAFGIEFESVQVEGPQELISSGRVEYVPDKDLITIPRLHLNFLEHPRNFLSWFGDSVEGHVIVGLGMDYFNQVKTQLERKGHLHRYFAHPDTTQEYLQGILARGVGAYMGKKRETLLMKPYETPRSLQEMKRLDTNEERTFAYDAVATILNQLGMDRGIRAILTNPGPTTEELLFSTYAPRILIAEGAMPER